MLTTLLNKILILLRIILDLILLFLWTTGLIISNGIKKMAGKHWLYCALRRNAVFAAMIRLRVEWRKTFPFD